MKITRVETALLRVPLQQRTITDSQSTVTHVEFLQVVLHTQHHRGQVCARLRDAGGEPPTVDFIVWLWEGRPAAPSI